MSTTYFHRMIGHVLRPLARMSLRFGGTFPMLRDELKRAYFDVAMSDYAADGKSPTDSRIAVMTGLHRKEIREFRESESPPEVPMPLSTQIHTLWTSDPMYLNARGDADALPRKRSVGKERSFEALVERISKNVRSRTVLEELLARGEVTVNSYDEVDLSSEGVTLNSDDERKIFETIGLISQCMHAAFRGGDGERTNYGANFFNSLSSDAADELYIDGRRAINQIRSKINLKGTEYEQSSKDLKDAKHRVYFGFFQLKVDQERTPELHAFELPSSAEKTVKPSKLVARAVKRSIRK
jgi:Family of unknown function (DUF6502)